MNHEEFKKHIDDYLLDTLDDSSVEEFEAHYFECDECFLELQTHERLVTKNVPIFLEASTAKSRFWLRNPLLTFGSLFIAATLFIFIFNSYRLNQKLEEISSFSPPLYLQSEIRGNQPEANFPLAMTAYSHKKYRASLDYLKNIEEKNNPQVLFFTGMNHLLLKKNEQAIAAFDLIIDAMNPSYYDEAIYYKAIALVRLNKIEHALREFDNLSRMYSPFAPRAKRMIEKLKAIN